MFGAQIDVLQLLLDYAPAAIAIFDGEMNYIAASRRYLVDYGLTGQVVGRSHYDLLPEIPERWKESYRRCLAGAVEGVAEEPFLRANGTLDWVRWEIHPWYDSVGTIGGIILFSEVITERRQTAEALQQGEERFRTAFDNMLEGAQILSFDWRYLYLNPAAETHSRRLPRELLGKRMPEAWPGIESTELFAMIRLCMEERLPCLMENEFVYPDGSARWFELSIQPIPEGTLVLSVDITERRQSEALVYAQRDLARAVGNVRSSEEAWQFCLAIALRVSGLDCGGIYLLETEGQELELVHHAGLGTDFVRAVRHHPTGAPKVQRMLAGETAYFTGEAMEQDPRYRAEGLLALVSVPIRHQGRTIGCLNVASHTQAQIPEHVRQALETVAAEIGNFAIYFNAASSLRESEEKYRSLVEASDAAIIMADVDGRIHYANAKAAETMACPIADIVGKTINELQPKAVADESMAQVRAVVADDQGLVVETARGTKWYRSSVQPVHDASGNPVMAMMTATDITAVKQTQQELQELNRTLEARVVQRTAEVQDLYDNSPSGYHSLDADGIVTRINQTELKWLGYTRDEMIGRPITEFLTPAGLTVFQTNFPALKTRGWLRDLEVELMRKDGSVLPALVSATAIYDDAGDYMMSRSTIFDNTERKKMDEALRLANAEMERAMRLKDEFLANMSHELRTPLNGILTLNEALAEQVYGPLNERQVGALQHVETSGRHLLALINDLLDLSKIEAGKLELDIELVVPEEICQASLQFVRDIAQKKRIKLGYEHSQTPASVMADPRRLKQMLVNLLSNAVKFTPEGGHVELVATVDPGAQSIEFAVQDTGPGIKPEHMARLFQPFVQLDAALSRQFEGTGLGLVLVKRLAVQHGGAVRAESSGIPGEGSRFTIVLPCVLLEGSGQDRDPDVTSSMPIVPVGSVHPGPCILIAEDNEVYLETVRSYLEHLGYRTCVARTGVAALERAGLQPTPDLILMDVQLPVIDGLEAIRRLRRNPHVSKLPIVAMTALAMPGDRERCMEAGASAYISKPVHLTELAMLIQQQLAG